MEIVCFSISKNQRVLIFQKNIIRFIKNHKQNIIVKHIFGDDSIFVKDEKFRNLFANFIVIKGDDFSDVQAKVLHIDEILDGAEELDQDEFTRRMDNFDIGYEVNSALVFAYVNHEEGLSFLTVAPTLLEGKKLTVYERDDDFNVRLDNKWEAVADLEFEYLKDLKVNAICDIDEYKSKIKEDAGVLKDDDKLSHLRSLKELDKFRNEEFPDDILVFFFKEGYSTEGIWVRYEDMNENKEIVGTLINNPNQNLGIKEGDRVKFKLSEDYGGLACCCDLDE